MVPFLDIEPSADVALIRILRPPPGTQQGEPHVGV